MLHSLVVLHPAFLAQIEAIMVIYGSLEVSQRMRLHELAQAMLDARKEAPSPRVRIIGREPAQHTDTTPDLLKPEDVSLDAILLYYEIEAASANGTEDDPGSGRASFWHRGG